MWELLLALIWPWLISIFGELGNELSLRFSHLTLNGTICSLCTREEKDHDTGTEIPGQETTAALLTTCQEQRSPRFGRMITHFISCSLPQIRSASHAREHSTKEIMHHLTCAYCTKKGTTISSKETFTTSEKVLVKRTSTITLICLVYVAATHYSNLEKYPSQSLSEKTLKIHTCAS